MRRVCHPFFVQLTTATGWPPTIACLIRPIGHKTAAPGRLPFRCCLFFSKISLAASQSRRRSRLDEQQADNRPSRTENTKRHRGLPARIRWAGCCNSALAGVRLAWRSAGRSCVLRAGLRRYPLLLPKLTMDRPVRLAVRERRSSRLLRLRMS